MNPRRLSLAPPVRDVAHLGFFRDGRVGDRRVLTNDAGDWLLLSEADWRELLAGRLGPEHPQWGALQRGAFVRRGADLDGLAARIARRKAFLAPAPHLHIVVTTLRCNQSCRYCHASRARMDRQGVDMSVQTARAVVDRALESPAPVIGFEFQGGEPTVNMPAVRAVVERARERGAALGKQVEFSLVSNFTHMDLETAEWLVEAGVMLCTSLDGPRDLHDANRPWRPGGGAWDQVMHWMAWFNARYQERGLDPGLWHVDALLTVTRATLPRWREVVELYVALGIRSLHLRPLNPYGFAVEQWRHIGYETAEFLDMYAAALDHIVALNRQGVELIEGTAAVFLAKMLSPDDPNYVDIRSPCGAGTGQVAYAPDGAVYPCDEARMVGAMGDERFALGHVSTDGLAELISHPTVRAMALASLQDSLPGCSTCWNLPFCGVCPMYSWSAGKDLFGQRPRSPKCLEYLTISTLLLERLAADPTGEVERVFRRWILRRPREQA